MGKTFSHWSRQEERLVSFRLDPIDRPAPCHCFPSTEGDLPRFCAKHPDFFSEPVNAKVTYFCCYPFYAGREWIFQKIFGRRVPTLG
jgi:hypothetical protein